MARLRDQTFSIFRFNILSYGVRLFTSAIVARKLGPEAMGLWILLSLFPSFADGFARLKVDVAAVYVLGRGRGTFGEVAGAIHLIAVVTGGGIAAILACAEPWVLPALFAPGAVSPWMYRMVLLTIPITFLAMNYAYLMLQREDVDGYNKASFLRGVLPSVLAAALLLFTPLRIGALVCGLMSGAVGGLVYGLVRLRNLPPPEWPGRSAVWKELFAYSGRLYAGGLVENANQYLSSLFLGLYLRPSDLTFFRMGQDRVQILDQIPASLNTLLYPRIANTDAARDRNALIATSCRVLLLLLCIGGGVGALLTPSLVLFLYGEAFAPVVRSIWLLLPGLIGLGATQPVMQYLTGSGRADLAWKLALVPLAVQLVLIVPLMNALGFQGAAIAVTASFLVYAVVRVLAWSSLTGENGSRLVFVGRSDVQLVRGFLSELLARQLARFRRSESIER